MDALEKIRSPRKGEVIKGNGHLIPQIETRAEMTEHLGMGWIPDHPDFRDYTLEHKENK